MRIQQLTGVFTPVLVLLLLVIAVAPQRAAYARGQAGSEAITHSGIGVKQPGYLAVDTHGNVYVSDQGNNRVVELMPTGKTHVLSQAFTKNGPDHENGGPAGIAIDRLGHLYLVAAWSTKARTGLLTNVADVAVDTQGHVYVSEGSVNLIRELSSTGASLVTWQ